MTTSTNGPQARSDRVVKRPHRLNKMKAAMQEAILIMLRSQGFALGGKLASEVTGISA